ncbi:MAG: efflux RND transporter periplasmic adaptor subunit [Rikenellaceae bacterium]|nr:efflux RND transporter periplasmic adaptor subunit [Rikenellaceae bacterium]
MKQLFTAILALAVTLSLSSCGNRNTSHDEHAHDHAGHTHEAHDHSTHNHSHEGHDHSAHSHEGHSHAKASDDHSTHNHAQPEAEHNHNENEITFPADQAARTDFKVEEIVPSTFNHVIPCTARILAAQGDEATIVAPISGVVSFGGKRLSTGAQVSRGQSLFTISSRDLASGSQVDKIAADYRRAEAEYNRLKQLIEEQIVSRSEFEAAENEYLKAKAEYDAVAARSSEKGSNVGAPIAGYITSLAVSEGDFVEMGQPLATVSQNRRLQLRADLPQRYYRELRTIKTANIVDPATGESYRLADCGGRLLSVGRIADSGSTLIPVTFEFDNRNDLPQGAIVETYLIGAPIAEALVVPVTAVTEAQGLYYVYVQLDAECYERREVTLGASNGELVQLLSGIEAGDRVVTRGAVNVKMAAASGAIPHSHQH